MENTTDILQIKINKARENLTKESREAIDSVNWKLTILEMNKKYNPEQLESLGTETELLLCGILNPEDYPKELETRMQITKEEVNLLINEMDKLVFKKIQEDLEKRIAKKENILSINKPFIPDPNFTSLPESAQLAIANSNWKEKLYEIAKKYKLTISQMGALEEITIKVINNEIHPDKYEEELASKITILREDISNLVNDVNEGVLRKIREVMREQKNISEQVPDDKIPIPPYVKIEEKIETPKPIEIPIENIGAPINEPKNIMEEKLKSATISDHTVSDYSSPKSGESSSNTEASEVDQIPKPYDPYREAF